LLGQLPTALGASEVEPESLTMEQVLVLVVNQAPELAGNVSAWSLACNQASCFAENGCLVDSSSCL